MSSKPERTTQAADVYNNTHKHHRHPAPGAHTLQEALDGPPRPQMYTKSHLNTMDTSILAPSILAPQTVRTQDWPLH